MALIIFICIILISCFVQKIQGAHHPKIFGYGFGVVLTGSMEPNLPAGSFVIIHEENFKEDDIITYNHYTGRSVTHRVIAIDGESITTQGDANRSPDPVFSSNDVIGKVICHFSVLWIVIPVLIYTAIIMVYACIPERKDN